MRFVPQHILRTGSAHPTGDRFIISDKVYFFLHLSKHQYFVQNPTVPEF